MLATGMLAELPIALVAEGESFVPPGIEDFFPPAILFSGTPFQITRIWIIRIVATVALLLVFGLAARRLRLVPGRFQTAVEFLLDFVRVQIAEEILGQREARRYLPMLSTVFFTVLFFNLTGIIPGLNLAGTARVGIPLLLALWVFVTYWAAGIRAHGLGGYLRNNLFPPSLKKMPFMYLIVAPIEALQILVIRPASLTIRLVANMVAGHIMVALCLVATHFLLTQAHGLVKGISVLTLFFGIFMTLFEALVAFLQAYIFSLLAAVYINLSLESEH